MEYEKKKRADNTMTKQKYLDEIHDRYYDVDGHIRPDALGLPEYSYNIDVRVMTYDNLDLLVGPLDLDWHTPIKATLNPCNPRDAFTKQQTGRTTFPDELKDATNDLSLIHI